MNNSLHVPRHVSFQKLCHASPALHLHLLRPCLILTVQLSGNSYREKKKKKVAYHYSSSGTYKSTLEPVEKVFNSGRCLGKLEGKTFCLIINSCQLISLKEALISTHAKGQENHPHTQIIWDSGCTMVTLILFFLNNCFLLSSSHVFILFHTLK